MWKKQINKLAIKYMRHIKKNPYCYYKGRSFFHDYWKPVLLRMTGRIFTLDTNILVLGAHSERSMQKALIHTSFLPILQSYSFTLWSPSQTISYYPWISNDSHLRTYILPDKVDNEIYSLSFNQLEGISLIADF